MVDQGYLMHRPPPPSSLRLFIDQKAIPVLIDAAGALETQLELASVRTREQPLLALGLACAAGYVAALLLGSGRSREA